MDSFGHLFTYELNRIHLRNSETTRLAMVDGIMT